jgi:hypothetical protein
MRTVHVNVTLHLTLKLDDDTEVGQFVNELDYEATAGEAEGGDVEDSEMTDYEVTDSH